MKFTPVRAGQFYFAVCLTFFTIAINSQSHGWVAWYELYSTGQVTQAVVTRQQPEIHQRCFFKFTVGPDEFNSWGDGCSSLPVGEILSVTYLPADPSFVTLDAPGEKLASLLAIPLVLSVLVGILAAWQTKVRLRWASK